MTSMPLSKLNVRKFLKLLTVAVFVLTIGLYYLFSFLRDNGTQKEKTGESAFNTELPGPKLDDRYKNKLDLYMEARQDSLRKLNEARRDSLLFPEMPSSAAGMNDLAGATAEIRPVTGAPDRNVMRMEKAMERLQQVLARQEDESISNTGGLPSSPMNHGPAPADLARLEEIMSAAADSSPDNAEIKRLDGMLDKILEIREPGRASRKANPTSEDSLMPFKAFADGPMPSDNTDNGFYGISDVPGTGSTKVPTENSTISAVVHADQRVRTGSIVRLRLLQDIYIEDAKIPANSFVFGTATVAGERVQLEIRHAVHGNNVLPVKLSVFDIDGIAGISAPGADARDVSREGLNQAVKDLELYNMDPSIGAQAAASGIQAAKSLLSRKTKTPFAMLKANHTVMLVNSRL